MKGQSRLVTGVLYGAVIVTLLVSVGTAVRTLHPGIQISNIVEKLEAWNGFLAGSFACSCVFVAMILADIFLLIRNDTKEVIPMLTDLLMLILVVQNAGRPSTDIWTLVANFILARILVKICNLNAKQAMHIFAVGIVGFALLIAFIRLPQGDVFRVHEQPRWSAIWYNPNTFAAVMTVSMVYSVTLLIRQITDKPLDGWRGETKLIVLLIASVIFLICLFHTFSRGATLALLTATAVALYRFSPDVQKEWRPVLKRRWLLIVTAVAALGFMLEETLVGFARRLDGLFHINRDVAISNRLLSWKAGVAAALDSPWQGVGYDAVPTAVQRHGGVLGETLSFAARTNDYLVLGIACGLPILLLWLVIVVNAVIPRRLGGWEDRVCTTVGCILAIVFLIDGVLFKGLPSLLFFIAVGLRKGGEEDTIQLRRGKNALPLQVYVVRAPVEQTSVPRESLL